MRTETHTSWAGVLGEHRGDLVRTARSKLERGADAEDVVHDVVLRVLRGGRSDAVVEAPVAYLRRAVANECVSRWRRSSREVLVDDFPDHAGSRDDATACVQRMTLRAALAALPEQQRRVVLLSVLEDRPDEETAAALGIAPVTVRTTRRRALARLRELLEAFDRGDRAVASVAVPAPRRNGTRAARPAVAPVTPITARTAAGGGSAPRGRSRCFADRTPVSSRPATAASAALRPIPA